jgi:hypothetical protein
MAMANSTTLPLFDKYEEKNLRLITTNKPSPCINTLGQALDVCDQSIPPCQNPSQFGGLHRPHHLIDWFPKSNIKRDWVQLNWFGFDANF